MNGSYTDVDDGVAAVLGEAIARSASVLVHVSGERSPVNARLQQHAGSGVAMAMSAMKAPGIGTECTVFFCAGFQLHWFHAPCLSARRVEAASWLMTVGMPDEMPASERRQDTRIPLPSSLAFTAHLVVSSGLVEGAPVLDICSGGASLAVPQADFGVIRAGSHGDVTFCAGSMSVQVHARVAQVKNGQCGLEFVRALSDPLALYALDGVVVAARDHWLRDISARTG